jgi:hypothetical protein
MNGKKIIGMTLFVFFTSIYGVIALIRDIVSLFLWKMENIL